MENSCFFLFFFCLFIYVFSMQIRLSQDVRTQGTNDSPLAAVCCTIFLRFIITCNNVWMALDGRPE